MKLSIILDLTWKLKETEFLVDKGILFQNIGKSNVFSLNKEYFKRIECDDYTKKDTTHIILNDSLLDEAFPYWHTPYSIISVICNILVICQRFPITSYSIISSKDNFKTIWTEPLMIHSEYKLYETLTMDSEAETKIKTMLSKINKNFIETYSLRKTSMHNVKLCYKNFKILNKNNRVRNAFDFFFNAWHSHQLEHICINLSIVLESLFSPNDNRELIHQIAFNASHFVACSKDSRKNIYDIIKKFYNIRSRIVHGGQTKHNELAVMTSVVFIICSDIMKLLLLNTELLDKFSSSTKRNILLKKYMFN